jgi:hypothetical protein
MFSSSSSSDWLIPQQKRNLQTNGDNETHEFESGGWVLYGSSYISSSTFRNIYTHNVINFHLISSDAPEIPVLAINLGCGTLGNGELVQYGFVSFHRIITCISTRTKIINNQY